MKSGPDTEVRFVYCFSALTLTASRNKGGLASLLVTNYCTFSKTFKIIENFDVKLTYVPYNFLDFFGKIS